VDVWDYLADREREIRALSAHSPDLHAAEEEGSDGKRGRILARVWLNDAAFVQCHEVIRVEGEHITREKYAYYLCLDGQEIGGYERDPTHDPAAHKHCSDREEHERLPGPTVSFKQAVEEAWDYVSGIYPEGPLEP
jgi:hypothetical protein